MDVTDLLIDPLDHSPLTITRDASGTITAIASQSGTYRVTNGHPDLIPDPLPADLAARQALWDKLQDNGNFTYEADPALNLSTDDGFAQDFQSATGIKGAVLDIGCGPQIHSPRYLDGEGIGPVVGLDPLPGAATREFPFLIGISEALPFADASFDGVVFCRSLDHVLDTASALREAMRVLRPGGTLCVVMDLMSDERQSLVARLSHLASRGMGQFIKSARAHGVIHAARYIWTVGTLKVPEGAEDMFHMHFPSTEEVEGVLRETGCTDVRFHNLSEDETICIAVK
ncbi:MAG: class I SAM-dependent methyltransferase [Thalassovita sp.]